jgi:hypothetical protein
MTHGKQTPLAQGRQWPESAVIELVEMIERLNRWPRVGSSEELDGEYDDWRAAEALLRHYKPAVAATSSHVAEQSR